MKRKERRSLAVFVIISALALNYLIGRFLYLPERNVADESATFSISAVKLSNEYRSDGRAADKKYLNQVIEVNGTVTSVSDSLLTVGSSVVCGFDKRIKGKLHDPIIVKGRCIGFDALFEEVKLDQCVIKEN